MFCRVKTKIVDRFEFNKLCNKDTSIKDRIRFFSKADYNQEHCYHILLLKCNKIIGVAKIAGFKNEKADVTISYFSIDRKYRGKGYTNLLSEAIMLLCIEHNYSLSSSSWTYVGGIKLRPNIKKHAKIHNVTFIDNDKRFDAEWSYNSDFIDVSEMTAKEKEKHNKNK